jgi:hypothetical protein
MRGLPVPRASLSGQVSSRIAAASVTSRYLPRTYKSRKTSSAMPQM